MFSYLTELVKDGKNMIGFLGGPKTGFLVAFGYQESGMFHIILAISCVHCM